TRADPRSRFVVERGLSGGLCRARPRIADLENQLVAALLVLTGQFGRRFRIAFVDESGTMGANQQGAQRGCGFSDSNTGIPGSWIACLSERRLGERRTGTANVGRSFDLAVRPQGSAPRQVARDAFALPPLPLCSRDPLVSRFGRRRPAPPGSDSAGRCLQRPL